MSTELLYIATHPIQYQAPLLRRIAAEEGINLSVCFEHLNSAGSYFDDGFGVEIDWDVPLLDGYAYSTFGSGNLEAKIAQSDVVWVHGWQSPGIRAGLRRASRLSKPILMRGENWAGGMTRRWVVGRALRRIFHRRILSQCSAFLAIGSANRQFYLDFGIPSGVIFDMPYAVDNVRFRELSAGVDDAAARQRFGLAADVPVVLFAGKLTRRKLPDLLLQAWLEADWPEGRPALVFAGDGEMKNALAASAPADVFFTGFQNQSDMPTLYALADVFVLPSQREPWGLAINEAMACGTAVIASDECGAAFDLVDDSCGKVVPSNNASALSAALQEVVQDSRRRGVAAQEKIRRWSFDEDIAGLKSALSAVLP